MEIWILGVWEQLEQRERDGGGEGGGNIWEEASCGNMFGHRATAGKTGQL